MQSFTTTVFEKEFISLAGTEYIVRREGIFSTVAKSFTKIQQIGVIGWSSAVRLKPRT